MVDEERTILSLNNICKSFSGVEVLHNIDLDIKQGEIHAIVGENGAGKSTLVNIIMGVYQPNKGELYLHGDKITFTKPKDALDFNFRMIFQELNLFPNLSVAENIFMEALPLGLTPWNVNKKQLLKKTEEFLKKIGLDLDSRAIIHELGTGQQQMVQICKAMASDVQLMIMDEPTSSLSQTETARLFDIVKFLKSKKVTVIYISHRLEEIFKLADRVTVLRDGHLVNSLIAKDTSMDELVSLMVGREVNFLYGKRNTKRVRHKVFFEVKNFKKKGQFKNINIEAYKNEILGIYGLVGAGRSELALSVFGYMHPDSGMVYIDGKKVQIDSPREAISKGILYLSEDRKILSIFHNLDLRENVTISNLKNYSDYGFPKKKMEVEQVTSLINKLDIRASSIYQKIEDLSGGNQQKTVIARLLTLDSKVMIFDEPTRGVDVGAKAEIHKLIMELADEGNCIIVISSELPEIIGISDRVIVFRQGEISGEFSKSDEINQETLLKAASPLKSEEIRDDIEIISINK